MKRTITVCLMMLLAALLLSGCTARQDPHPEWSADWFRMYSDLAIEHPSGFALNESNDIMSIAGLYYATWTTGESRSVTNGQGNPATAYDAQIYTLVKRCETTKEAEENLADWMKRERTNYETGEETVLTAADQQFSVLPLLQAQAGNPYRHGIAAFALRGTDAISVELVWSEGWQGDGQAVLASFLNGFHYGR